MKLKHTVPVVPKAYDSDTAVPDLRKRSSQSAEWRASAYSFKQLHILKPSSQSITHCCQSASSSSSCVCTKMRRKSFIHDTPHLKPVFLTDSDSQEWGDIIRHTLCPNGAIFSFPIWNCTQLSPSLISIAATASLPGKVIAVIFPKHLQNTAVKCVTLRVG